ncbi:putative ankyrin repeat protein [Cladobotryum mycophilum]|uniref:Ankyrin repeat protein n=1 Tax=Cladobotryum mycophilum TaxID=491253 RepID=A0ABR0SVM8_9HYPO
MASLPWEKHKSEIRQLFIAEDKPLSEVIECMKTRYQFSSSKSQYEKKLKEWGIRKRRMGKVEWTFLSQRIGKRKRDQGKDSEVYIDGDLYPPAKVRKETARQGFITTIEKYNAPSPKTPQGIVVCTPPALFEHFYQRDEQIPWLRFSKLMNTHLNKVFVRASAEQFLPVPSTVSSRSLPAFPSRNLTGSLDMIVHGSFISPVNDAQSNSRIATILDVFMPEEYPGQHKQNAKSLCVPRSDQNVVANIKLQLFMLANNFQNEDYMEDLDNADVKIVQMARAFNQADSDFMKALISTKNATTMAIAEKILISALRSKDLNFLRIMLEAGASTSILFRSFRTGCDLVSPLEFAASLDDLEQSLDMTQLLLAHKSVINRAGSEVSALRHAIRKKNKRLVKDLITAGALVSADSLNLSEAIRTGEGAMVLMILEAGADIDARFAYQSDVLAIVEMAIRFNNISLILALLARIADVNVVLEWSQWNAFENADWIKVRSTSLGLAAHCGSQEIVQILLRNGATVNLLDDSLCCPLLLACNGGHGEVVKMLLHAGADIKGTNIRASTWHHCTCLMDLCVSNLDIESCQLLLNLGASINDNTLFRAFRSKQTGMVDLIWSYSSGVVKNSLQVQRHFTHVIEEGLLDVFHNFYNSGTNASLASIYGIDNANTAQFLEQVGLLQTLTHSSMRAILSNAITKRNNDLIRFLLRYEMDLGSIWCGISATSVGKMPIPTPLDCAVFESDWELSKTLIQYGASITADTLNAAVWLSTDGMMVRMLIDYGVVLEGSPRDLDKSLDLDHWWLRPKIYRADYVLIRAVVKNNRPMLQLLLGAAQWQPKTMGVALVTASYKHPQLIEDLLKAGASLDEGHGEYNNDFRKHTYTALTTAVSSGQTKLVRTLLQAGASADKLPSGGFECTALQIATIRKDPEMIKVLLQAGANVNAAIEILLQAGADVNVPADKDRETALQNAAQKGNLEVIKILLQAGADVNSPATRDFGETALQSVVRQENLEIIEVLLEAGADVNAPAARHRSTALQYAVKEENLEIIKILLQAGANVNAVVDKYDGKTILRSAVEKENLEIIKILLQAGADVNAPLEILLQAGADVNAPAAKYEGATALQYAAINGCLGIARRLLELGADVNAPAGKRDGRTALEGAAEYGRIDTLHFLLSRGAEVHDHGRSQFIRAVKFAETNGQNAAAFLLKQHGGWTDSDSDLQALIVLDDSETSESDDE